VAIRTVAALLLLEVAAALLFSLPVGLTIAFVAAVIALLIIRRSVKTHLTR
jgi:hypothetical protein